MAAKHGNDKKSLKQPDEFINFSSRLLQQTIAYRNHIIGVLAAIVVVIAVFSAVNYFARKSEDQSLLLLSRAVARYEALQAESGDVQAYDTVKKEFQSIMDAYGSKSGGKFANFYLANCSFDAGDFDASESLYRQSVSDFKGVQPFETLAKSSLGYTLSQKGDHEGAAAVFAELAASETAMTDEVLFALSRQYGEMGKTDLERETARKLLENYPDSIYTNVIQEKYTDLSAASAG